MRWLVIKRKNAYRTGQQSATAPRRSSGSGGAVAIGARRARGEQPVDRRAKRLSDAHRSISISATTSTEGPRPPASNAETAPRLRPKRTPFSLCPDDLSALCTVLRHVIY
jgi:hypothetical protein